MITYSKVRFASKSGVRVNPDEYPLIAFLIRGKYGVTADYMTADGRVCEPTRAGGNYREIKETDMVFDSAGNLISALNFFNDSLMTHRPE